MRVPHPSRTCNDSFDIPFNDNCSRRRPLRLPDQLGYFDRPELTRFPNFEDRTRVVLITKIGPRSHDHREAFACDFQINWDVDGVSDDIGAMVKVGDLPCGSSSVQEVLDSGGIVSMESV
jgi:hypothetical protein